MGNLDPKHRYNSMYRNIELSPKKDPLGRVHRIIGSFTLEKTFKIIETN